MRMLLVDTMLMFACKLRERGGKKEEVSIVSHVENIKGKYQAHTKKSELSKPQISALCSTTNHKLQNRDLMALEMTHLSCVRVDKTSDICH